MRTRLILFLCIIPLLGIAQGVKKIKLEDAIKLGLDQSRSLKISESKMAIADSKYVQLKDMVLPKVNLSAGYARLSDVTPFVFQLTPTSEPITFWPVILNNYNSQASISESVFNGLRLKNGIQSQQYLLEAAKLDYEKDRA